MREFCVLVFLGLNSWLDIKKREISLVLAAMLATAGMIWTCLLYTSPSPRDPKTSRMPSSA